MKLEKALKNLDQDTVKEIEALDEQELKHRIVQANQSIDQAEKELQENPEYVRLKESLKAITASFKDLKKRQESIICVSLNVLESKGK